MSRMGKRCRQAALGATFALLVAACAADDSPPSADSAVTGTSASSTSAAGDIPSSLASADVVDTEVAGSCLATDNAALTVFATTDGSTLWSMPISPPSGETVLHDNVLFFSLAWQRERSPGVAAVDLENEELRWERSFEEEPEQLVVVGRSLIVVSRNSIRAVDLVSGEDKWIIGNEFVFTEAIVEGGWAYAIDNVAVHGINLRTGELTWRLPIERPDELAARGGLLAVAARNTVIAVDIGNRSTLWEEQVNRVGSGDMWVGPDTVIVEVAPSESPTGGLVALDRGSGIVRWRLDGVDAVHWPSAEQIVTSVPAPEYRGPQRYDIISIDASTGDLWWALPTTVPGGEGILSVSDDRALIHEPHPAVAGVKRLRLIDTVSGATVWETSSTQGIDGARIEADSFVSTYRTDETVTDNRGTVELILGPGRVWTSTTQRGIEQDSTLSPVGLIVLSGERSPVCVGRELGEPN